MDHRQKSTKGFTLIEVLIFLLISTILTLISLALYQRSARRSVLQGEAIALATRLEQAKTLAIAQSRQYRITFNENSGAYIPETYDNDLKGWVIGESISSRSLDLNPMISYGFPVTANIPAYGPSITKIASVTKRPGMVIGMHFMNPVPVMKLVEIINGYATSKEVTQKIVELSKQLGKTPCVVNDYPGFIANRILMPMINEAIYSLHEGVAGVEEIDTIMKLGMAHPMGPLQLADFIGLDVCQSILNVMQQGFGNPKYAPCPLLANMVAAGKLGIKSGEGFYVYTAGSKELLVSDRFKS